MKGSTVRATFQEALSKETNQLQELTHQQHEISSQNERLRQERKSILGRLASAYLGAWDKVRAKFDETSKQIDQILARREERSQEILKEETVVREKINQSSEKIADTKRLIEEEERKVESLKEKTFEILGEEYAQLEDTVEETNALIESDRKRLEQISRDCDQKLAPFRASVLFTYLLKRTQDGRKALSGLDRWVGKVAHFEANLRSWQVLTNLPTHVQKANQGRVLDQIEAQTKLDALWKKGAEESGLEQAQAREIHLREVLASLDREKSDHERGLNTLLAEAAGLDQGTDAFLQSAQDQIEDELGEQNLSELKTLARSTKGTEDDQLVDRLEQIERELESSQVGLKRNKTEIDAQKRRIERLEEVLSGIDRNNYDSTYSRVNVSDVALGALIGAIIQGHKSSNSVITEIGHSHRKETPPPRPSYTSSSSRSSGGFRTGGSIGGGGGGFRTGGGF